MAWRIVARRSLFLGPASARTAVNQATKLVNGAVVDVAQTSAAPSARAIPHYHHTNQLSPSSPLTLTADLVIFGTGSYSFLSHSLVE